MTRKGTILKIKENAALLMTSTSEFVLVAKRQGMDAGQEIFFDESDILVQDKKSYRRRFTFTGIAAAALILIFLPLALNLMVFTSKVYAYIDLDINPSLQLLVDKQGKILDVRALNEDAKDLMTGLTIKNATVTDGLHTIILKSRDAGFIKNDNENVILLTVSLNQNGTMSSQNDGSQEVVLDELLGTLQNSISDNAENGDISARVLTVAGEIRKQAQDNHISMGRQAILSKARNKGKDISIDKIKSSRVADIINTISEDGDEADLSLSESDHYLVREFKPADKKNPKKDSLPKPAPQAPVQSGSQSDNKDNTDNTDNPSTNDKKPSYATPGQDVGENKNSSSAHPKSNIRKPEDIHTAPDNGNKVTGETSDNIEKDISGSETLSESKDSRPGNNKRHTQGGIPGGKNKYTQPAQDDDEKGLDSDSQPAPAPEARQGYRQDGQERLPSSPLNNE